MHVKHYMHSCLSQVFLQGLSIFIPCHLVCFPPRHQPWLLARLSMCSSTNTALWWLSASVPLRGAGEVGFKRWSVPSSSPDPLLPIASRMNLLHDFPLFCFVCPSSVVSVHYFRTNLSTGLPCKFMCSEFEDEINLDLKPVE